MSLELTYSLLPGAAAHSTTVLVSAVVDGQTVHSDKLDVTRSSARERFVKEALKRPEVVGVTTPKLRDALLAVCAEVTASAAPSGGPRKTLDTSRLDRPECFHRPEVSGITFPIARLEKDRPVGQWAVALRWTDGRREVRDLSPSIDLPDGRPLWFSPMPAVPGLAQRCGWSAASREAWLRGAEAPDPGDVLARMGKAITRFIELPEEYRAGTAATIALWSVMTYCARTFDAVPYLAASGPAGSGKSRTFEVLARLVFRPIVSASMTAACLFRTLNDVGGTALMDEAERLKDTSPEVGELRAVLLSGYKQGTPCRRLENIGDGKFQTLEFDTFGPKALASISTLPAALASRCIRLFMFRSAPGSDVPRRRLDDDPSLWSDLRDDLHIMALENGREWLALSGRVDVVPTMSGRNFELWAPLCSLAAWFEERGGVVGLLDLIQSHALHSIESGSEEAMPDTDETILKLMARVVLGEAQYGTGPGDLLKQCQEAEPALFGRWTTRGLAAVLKRYGLESYKANGRRDYRTVTTAALAKIEAAYGYDLSVGHDESSPLQPMPGCGTTSTTGTASALAGSKTGLFPVPEGARNGGQT